ncbi:DUF1236 domain-containing protein [Prosthecomicrobium sp. N25]|uniref:DUF1236 domain-containing protein n=1 Tax=Prosthecomicrobium sp. N25 TaxID=3129254 RepID=UPI0030776F84
MRTLLMTGTAVAALLAGLATVSAQTGDPQIKRPGATQERQDSGTPSRSDSAPGQNRPAADDANRPGRSEAAPGQNRPQADDSARPGRSESAPGQNRAQDDSQRRRQYQAGQDQDRNKPEADQNRRRDAQGDDANRDRNKSAEDQNLRERDKNRNAQGDDANRDRNKSAEDQNLRERDKNRNAQGDDANRDRNKSAEDQNLRERDKNRNAQDRDGAERDRNKAADDQNQRDRDRNRQAGSDKGDGPDAKLSVKLKGEERSRVTATLVERAKPVERSKIKFNINVGTSVPRGEIELHSVPETIVSIVPQYRGYRYFVVEDEIVIVEPSSYRIVEVIDRSGGGGSTGSARIIVDRSKFGLIKRELKPHQDIKIKITTRQGEVLPDDVELQSIPRTVVEEVPELREYRYVYYNNEVLLVEPQSRRIVEVIE